MIVDRFWLIGLVVLLVSCGGKGPQIPSKRSNEPILVDSTALALMEMNQQLAQAADEQLMKLAMSQDEPYALYEAHTWIHIIDRGDTDRPAPKYGQVCQIHTRTYDLNGTLLLDAEGTYTRGKNELPPALDRNIGELHPGGKARMYAPWYSAYGITGKGNIPPYENVIIEIELR